MWNEKRRVLPAMLNCSLWGSHDEYAKKIVGDGTHFMRYVLLARLFPQ